MPVTGNTDFSADFLRGAQVGNMRVMQQERMMELRSQDALRRVQERNLAAEAEATAYKLQVAQQDAAEEKSALQFADQLHHTLTETMDPGDKSPEEVDAMATKATDQWLLAHSPKTALKVGQARMMMAKPELAQQAMQTKKDIVDTQQTGLNQRNTNTVEGKQGVADTRAGSLEYSADKRLEGMKYSADKRLEGAKARVGPMVHAVEYRIDLQRKMSQAEESGDFEEADLLKDNLRALDALNPGLRQKEAKLPDDVKMKVADLYREKDATLKQAGKLDPDEEGNKTLRFNLSMKAGQIQKRIDALTGDAKSSPSGTVRVRKPDGTVGNLPASRLDEALKSGWKKVE